MNLRKSLLAFALFLGAPAWAGESSEWRPVDAETGQIRDIDGLEQLTKDFPDSGSVRLRLLQSYLAAGQTDNVLATLSWLYDRGYVFSDRAQQQIPTLFHDVEPGSVAAMLHENAEVIEASDVVATVPASVRLVENVVRDPSTGEYVVSAVHSRQIARLNVTGETLASPIKTASNLSGLVLSSEGIIWAASGNIDGSDPNPELFFGLLGFDEQGQIVRRIVAPDRVNPSDLVISPDGILFTSDPIGGGVYTASEQDLEFSELIAPGILRSPQGLALSEDGSLLYVSDYRYGIAIINLVTGDTSRLASQIPIILDGVDGLWRHGNELIAVQNGTSPMKISAFELSQDGSAVVAHRILEQAHSDWSEPLNGSIDGNTLLYVGNGQWDRYVAGSPAQDKPPQPTQIRRLPID
ncbi:MAG: hypothetical protein ABJP48_01585 [Erythrobacter sp.]